MRKATFLMSALSVVASISTLAVVLVGAKKVEAEVQDIRVKTNAALSKLKIALVDFTV